MYLISRMAVTRMHHRRSMRGPATVPLWLLLFWGTQSNFTPCSASRNHRMESVCKYSKEYLKPLTVGRNVVSMIKNALLIGRYCDDLKLILDVFGLNIASWAAFLCRISLLVLKCYSLYFILTLQTAIFQYCLLYKVKRYSLNYREIHLFPLTFFTSVE